MEREVRSRDGYLAVSVVLCPSELAQSVHHSSTSLQTYGTSAKRDVRGM